MPELGKKYMCYSCHTKFYDLGKSIPLCPKCGANQRDAEDRPVVTPRSRARVVEEPVEEPEFTSEAEVPAGETDEEEEIAPARGEEASDDDEEEEEEY